MERDEREEFLRRENELQDQLAEKESQITTAQQNYAEAKEELQILKESTSQTGQDNEKLNTEVNELRMQLERVAFEGKEANITMDALKEANHELTTELDEVKQQLLDAKMSAKETGAVLDEKERKKVERMAQMMAGFDLGDDVLSENEKHIRRCIDQIEAMYEASTAGEVVSAEELQDVKSRLVDAQRLVRQADIGVHSISNGNRRSQELEDKFLALNQEYRDMLEAGLEDVDIEEVKARLERIHVDARDAQLGNVDDLKQDIVNKMEDNRQLRDTIEELTKRAKTTNGVVHSPNGRTIQQQIQDFDVMKKSLMRDLQNRCERVVELEISLDETREQYNNVLRTSNNRAQQKKMAFLERNLEQLTHVQRQLVEQNGSLKKEVAIAERKLIARNDRILSLEALLGESQEKLTAANHRYIFLPPPNSLHLSPS